MIESEADVADTYIPPTVERGIWSLIFGQYAKCICTTRPLDVLPGGDQGGQRSTTRRKQNRNQSQFEWEFPGQLYSYAEHIKLHKTVMFQSRLEKDTHSCSLSLSLFSFYLSLNTQKSESFWHSTMNAICKIRWGVEAASPTKYANFLHTHKAKEMTGNNFTEMPLTLSLSYSFPPLCRWTVHGFHFLCEKFTGLNAWIIRKFWPKFN